MTRNPEPHHEFPLRPMPHRVVCTWPTGTFLENICVLDNGEFAISVHNQRKLIRASRQGHTQTWCDMPAPPAGLITFGDGALVVAGEPGEGPHHVYRVASSGQVEHCLTVPDSLFLNGFTPGPNDLAYTVDSLVGAVIEIDLEHRCSRILVQDELLTKCSDEPMLPGANGIKYRDGALFVTNTDRACVLRVDLAGKRPVHIDLVAEHLRGDDLAIDADGRLYITNHIHNTLTRVNADGGERVAVAGPEQGMPGCTACTFHRDDPGALYVVTTGGIIMPFGGRLQDAKLVRLETGARGLPLPSVSMEARA